MSPQNRPLKVGAKVPKAIYADRTAVGVLKLSRAAGLADRSDDMNVTDLINRLKECPPDAMVYAFDPDTGDMEPVTGLTSTEGNNGNGLPPMVDLHTDDMGA